ncbi:uncharacterized protein TrAtP1_004806 [Trichoderma atroviride]|uniref:uncharacterized protein n=1 Tax=Hypocrea atroviridis TaxID=63577 RepID=UPI00332D8FDC|nr:hypothetical protein TrAtP1_004806 [Trichoderma atroviride]
MAGAKNEQSTLYMQSSKPLTMEMEMGMAYAIKVHLGIDAFWYGQCSTHLVVHLDCQKEQLQVPQNIPPLSGGRTSLKGTLQGPCTASSSPWHHLRSSRRHLCICPETFSSFDLLQVPVSMYWLLDTRNEETADQTLSKSFRRCACAGGATLGTASPCGEAKTQRPEGSKALLQY